MSDTVLLDESNTPLDLRLSEAELEATREHVIDFVADQVESAGLDGAVLGLSGGIDSTTVAYIAAEALGADAVHGLVMPGEVNTEGNMSDAERVAEDLGIEYDVVGIESIAETFYEAFPAATEDRMAKGNVRVRVRGVLNYFVANAEDKLVLGTGNRSEALVGYFTKYGDGAVDCHPIGNLYKQQVRQLADFVGVPRDLVMKTPSAEMWEGQTDEEELGLTYDTLDAILALHVDGPLSTSATVEHLGVPESAVERVEELYEVSKHKRSMPPAPDELRL
ncbi:NAD+ synthase [Halorarum halophilum]|uniref:NH(3)-dependent NAD(+) synthetase n=1 Tax=Halorarum halophilum TaxID=2743090 RepID=A0A7D5GC33_9EURY|nr:NAD+ synthase [Halobaculum halophilum]QLG27972.1 NAD+ synthase [Halobaculum halophilum]